MESNLELLEVIREEERKRRSQMRGLLAAWGGIFAGFAVLLLISWLKLGPPDLVTLLCLFTAFSSFPTFFALTSTHRRATEAAAKLDDPSFVPHLLDILDSDASNLKRVARGALRTNLGKITLADQALFDRRHLHLLSGLLKSRDSGLRQPTIVVLGRVGDAQALKELEAARKRRHSVADERLFLEALTDLRYRIAGESIRREFTSPTISSTEFEGDKEIRA